ncbi:S-DNA-T family DNA segregation ATPase FtsK/SpoIIIE [Kitasatospora sp. MAA19]|uniref:FtsK/SpoIIIE domain-containing protein n=1 Tax=Kitasatospora sp. MAA19 TaxID=3035090 RepID=UPI002476E99A|nr:FtsK/SpoIIIE domain-containing protein [Kitasatospora sp. MAA19]MDH6705562.1 S-DNA-T family DNA segregation ATPase FtsK/SpoIIIE [Kitasatospora sp. MAA19]
MLILLATAPGLRRSYPYIWWCVLGYPVTVIRVRLTWRRLTTNLGLAVAKRPGRALLGDLVVRGDPLKPVPPRLGVPKLWRGGLDVAVRMHPGQVPDHFLSAVEALTHAWRVHAVRLFSDERGFVTLSALAWDPLWAPVVPYQLKQRVLRAVVGLLEDGRAWVIDFRRAPHWLIVGATRSGKSTLIASLVKELAPQRVALFGIDLKGGIELSLFEDRLSALASTRAEAARLLAELVAETEARMQLCRSVGARSIWDLPAKARVLPVVLIVDEVAELYLMATWEDKAEVGEISTNLLRLSQLGAALGVHLIIAGQRVGSDLGPGVTALRAQLAGRVCHRVSDAGTAEMVLGDLNKNALEAAQRITLAEQGVAITADTDGRWTRARSIHVTPDQARPPGRATAHMARPGPGDPWPWRHPP